MILNKQYFFTSLISLLSVQTLFASYNSSTLNRLALLICTFIKIGLDYKILDFYFLGLTYIIVYVGAIAILFLFVIMMAETHLTPLMNSNNKEINDSPVIKSSTMQVSSNSYILRIPTTKDNFHIHYNHPSSYSQTLNFSYNHSIFLGSTLVIILLTQNYLLIDNLLIFNADTYTPIWNYNFVEYTSEFITFTDIQSQGFLLYLAFPFITVLLGIILWCVLVGILRISL